MTFPPLLFRRAPEILFLVAITLCGLLSASASAQTLDRYFASRVAEIEAATEQDFAAVTKQNWPETKELWRDQLREMLGIPQDLERTDLAVTKTGAIELEGVRVEKLHYQARPGLYVTANLYLPTEQPPEEGWPAVLYVCGHARATDNGRLLGNKTGYQHHGLWLARHGFVCLMIDTVQLGELHGEHHGTYKLGRWDWMSRGYTPAGVEAWSAIRAVDLLVDMKQVDASKIGVTGRSGGGAYSWFAAALDERIRVAIPVAGITDLRNHVIDGCVEGHCDCMYFVNYFGWDYGKLAALIAPRPLLLENSDSDSIFPLDGVVRIDGQLRSLYSKLEASQNYGLVITPGPHKDTQDLRIPAFRFLMKHLKGVADPVIRSPALKELDGEKLAVFERESPANEQVTSVSNWFAPQAEVLENGKQNEALDAWRDSWLPQLIRRGILPAQVSIPELKSQKTQVANLPTASLKLEEFATTGQLLQYRLQKTADPGETILHLVLDTQVWENPEQAFASDVIQQRIAAMPGQAHAFYRFSMSAWRHDQNPSVKKQNQLARRFYLLGETIEQKALHELLSVMLWISQTTESEKLSLAATDRESAIMTFAALYAHEDERVGAVKAVYFNRNPEDEQLAGNLLGLSQICSLHTLQVALEQATAVRSAPITATSPQLLVDSSSEPKQANGMRIVEVSDRAAKIWVRATRYDLPNLGDLPEVEFAKKSGRTSSGAILPEQGVDGLRFAVPGVLARVRAGVRAAGEKGFTYSSWTEVDASSDFSTIAEFGDLRPQTRYSVRTQVQSADSRPIHTLTGSFKTLPALDSAASFKLAVSTCQGFPDRDGPHGFDMYRTILRRNTDAFVMAGDVVYYDRLARSNELAYYHWQRTYSLPTLLEFHRRVPSYFLKDDHDTYVNDSWPGEKRKFTDDFEFGDGQKIFIQETGLPSPAYRTIRVGRDLQVWMMEGRDFRSPNTQEDGPAKTIWGTQQKTWLEQTLKESDAAFKVIISPTPIVGPDRDKKSDNHANRVFETEGKAVRKLLSSFKNLVVVCGDRHWQFHSVDPETGLHEFSVGPASDRHAGGWKQEDYRPEIHRFLRVAGGYLEIELVGGDTSQLILRHLDTAGKEHHRHTMSVPSAK